MRIFIALCVICASALTLSAQTAGIAVSYNYKHFHRTGREQNHQMILHSGNTCSKFYNPVTAYLDSLESTPEGATQYKQVLMSAFTKNDLASAPKRSVCMYVVNDKASHTRMVYDGNTVVGFYKYAEQIENQNWEMCDSSTEILGYDCSMATCDYRGRRWIAWFTSDIPIPEGPWKLGGLPGLILAATDSTGQHGFVADGISAASQRVEPVIDNKYDRTDRLNLLKIMRAYEEDPIGAIQNQFGSRITIKGGIKFDHTLDFLETDYH